MKQFRYFLTSITLFFHDGFVIAKDQEEAEEFYNKFHKNDLID